VLCFGRHQETRHAVGKICSSTRWLAENSTIAARSRAACSKMRLPAGHGSAGLLMGAGCVAAMPMRRQGGWRLISAGPAAVSIACPAWSPWPFCVKAPQRLCETLGPYARGAFYTFIGGRRARPPFMFAADADQGPALPEPLQTLCARLLRGWANAKDRSGDWNGAARHQPFRSILSSLLSGRPLAHTRPPLCLCTRQLTELRLVTRPLASSAATRRIACGSADRRDRHRPRRRDGDPCR